MFLGVVHANARQILASYIPELPKHVHVICSGNFSIETTLRLNGYQGEITGCDVSLYTCMLGAYFAGLDLPLSLNPEKFPDLAPLADFLGDQEGRAAAVAVALDALQFHKQNSNYAVRMWKGYARSIMKLAEATRARLRKKRDEIRLNAFFPRDGWERASEVPAGPDHAVLTFQPTYSSGYEKLYAAVDQLFSWEQPSYKELTSGTDFARRMLERDGPWIIGAENPSPELAGVLGRPVSVSPRGSGVNIYLYSNIPALQARVLRRQINAKECPFTRLTDRDEIGSDSVLSIHRIDSSQANYIRQVYVSVEVGQAAAQYSYAVAVDGKLIGILLFQDFAKGMFKIEGVNCSGEMIYMMADLAIASERHQRLSKLVLMASLSSEMQDELARRTIKDLKVNVTTAFSRNPVSMKYRGIMELYSRKQQGEIYKLNYFGRFGALTLADTMRTWFRKHYKSTSSTLALAK